jgi:predicted nucleotidyltransferase
MTTEEPIHILVGIAGSHAHGLATPASDKDYHGVFSWPTPEFWSLRKPKETLDGHDPDYSYQELAKFLALAAGGNPTILETLWLPEYEEKEPYWGDELISIREHVLSADRVYHAFIGYAESQFRKLVQRGDTFSAKTSGRVNKHARHLFRLLETGHRLYQTGVMQVRVDDPESYQRYNEMTVDQIKEEFTRQWADFTEIVDRGLTPLPEKPDWPSLNFFLRSYRRAHI